MASILVGALTTAGAGVASVWGLFHSAIHRVSRGKIGHHNETHFYGSQLGGESVINYSYTDHPWKLLRNDIYYFFKFSWALPYIVLPAWPSDSGDLDELSFTWQNAFCVAVHTVLFFLQLAFIVLLPLSVMLPIGLVGLLVAGFLTLNWLLCLMLNGTGDITFKSNPKYARETPENKHEQWIFINGVAVGSHWMQNNLDRLAITFKRPVIGIHNRTEGIPFDVLECLIQRNLGYATSDVRRCYSIIKKKLYNPKYKKVVFILHSQGGIEGSMIIDWLLQELPQNLLSKLEVYTFGNAANHFNNPHRHMQSQIEAFRNPVAGHTDSTFAAQSNGHPPEHANQFQQRRPPTPTSPPPITTRMDGHSDGEHGSGPTIVSETSAINPSKVSDRAIGHIEHYAHTTDFVAIWGVLHFAKSRLADESMARFIGRVFERKSDRGGHQLCQHYLDGMFPLARDPTTGQLSRDPATGELLGCDEAENEFMNSEIVAGRVGDEAEGIREAMQISWLGCGADADGEHERMDEVEIHGSPLEQRGRWRERRDNNNNAASQPAINMKVKDLSRLWKYRNGKSPQDTPRTFRKDGSGVARISTM